MFKRIVSAVLAAVTAAAVSLPACADTEYREETVTAPPRVLVLGDSIATGFGLEGYEGGKGNVASYANILKDKYTSELPEECGFELNNEAVDGQTSVQLLEKLMNGDYDAELDVDCVLISIGGNDLLHPLLEAAAEAGITSFDDINFANSATLLGVVTKAGNVIDSSLEVFGQNISGIAGYITSHSEAKVIVQTLYDPLDGFSKIPGVDKVSAEKIGKLNEKIVTASNNGELFTVCDVAPLFKGKASELTNIGKFDIHPTAEGHKLIAEELDKTIKTFTYTYKIAEVTEPEEEENSDGSKTDSDSKSSDSGSTGYVILAVAGAVVLVGAVTVIVIVFAKKSKKLPIKKTDGDKSDKE